MDPKCLYGLDGSDSGFEMSFDSENEAAFSLDDTAGSEGFASSVSLADEDLQQMKPKKRRQRKTRDRSPTQVRARRLFGRFFFFMVKSCLITSSILHFAADQN